MADKAIAASGSRQSGADKHKKDDGIRILVVEDKGIVAKDVKSRLEALGYRVPRVVVTGAEAIAAVEETAPHVVLMDIRLRGSIDGVSAAAEIRRIYQVPVIYLTAFADEKTLERAKKTEPYGYILKPFEERELHTTIEMALYKSRMENRLRTHERWLAVTLKSIGDGVIATDSGEKVIFMNPRAETITGWETADAEGKPLWTVFKLDSSYGSMDGDSAVRKTGLREPVGLISKSGQRVPIELNIAPIEDDFKPPHGRVLIFRDITERVEADSAFEENQANLEAVIENTTDSIWSLDESYRITTLNSTFKKMFFQAHGKELNIGERILDYLGEMEPEWKNKYDRALSGQRFTEEQTYEISGQTLFVEVSFNPILGEGGRTTGVSVFSRDITERKQAETRILASEEKFSRVFSASPDAITINRLSDGIYIDVNQGFLNATGFEKNEVVGRSVSELDVFADDEDRRKVGEILETEGLLRNYEFMYRSKSGRLGTALMSGELISIGGESGVLCVIRDITERKKAEGKLEESQKLIASISRNISDGIYRSTPDRGLVYVNQAFMRMFGYSSEDEILRVPVQKLYADRQRRTRLQKFLQEHGQLVNQEIQFQRKDGSTFWGLISTVAVVDEAGRIQYYDGAISDITERKIAEESVENQRKFLRQLIDANPNYIFAKDPEGRFTLVNEVFASSYGLSTDEMIGKTDEQVHSDLKEVAFFKRLDREVLETGEERIVPDQFVKNADGTENWVKTIKRVIKAEDGENKLVLSVSSDITDRKLAEKALAAEKEHLAVTLRSINDGVITTDTKGVIALVNMAASDYLGFGPVDIVGKPLNSVVHVVDLKRDEQIRNLFERIPPSGGLLDLGDQPVLISREEKRRYIAVSAAPIKEVEQRVSGFVLVIRDVSERTRLEEERMRGGRLESIGILAGGIAHDFNNILTAVIGNISLAQMFLESSDESYERLTDAKRAALQAKDLTQQLLTFSKGGSPIKVAASIKELIEESANFSLRGSNVKCSIEINPGVWPVEVDKGQINQVLNNLLINADQAMPSGGIVTIKTANMELEESLVPPVQKGRYVRISVADRGIGIAPDHKDKIFDPYFTTKQKGSGLGLATTYSIVKKHGGRIEVESTLNQGSVFTIYLPAADEAAVPKKKSKKNQPLTGNGRVLIMDDDDEIRKVLSRMLEVIGYEVGLAPDGDAALEMYRRAVNSEKPFDVVLMDLTIPGGKGGKETIRELLTLDSEAKAIVSSGYSNDPIMSEFKKHGFRGVIVKPFRVDELNKLLQEVIRS